MCNPQGHLTIEEREKIRCGREKGITLTEIARMLGRHKSTISREVRRNRLGRNPYQAHTAQQLYQQRRKACVRKRRLSSPKLQEFVVERLQDYWSPEQISGWLHRKRGKNVLAFVTIYRAIHRGYLPSTLRFCLRRHDWGYSPPSTEKRGRLQGYRSIHRRPPGAENRSRFGHWEADTIRGAQRKGCLATFVDRKSRYTLAWVMPDRKAQTLCTAMHSLFAPLPPSLRRSFTVDHGNEFFSFGHIEADLHTRLYFADPYCPRQRALNENTNGLLRQYFPKKFDFLSISQDDVLRVLASLNARPRKSLGFRSPAEVFPLHFI